MDYTDHKEASRLAYAAGKRFDGDYIEERRAIEDWMRREAASENLILQNTPPLYFRLYPQPIINPDGNSLYVNVPAEGIPTGDVTFTLEDSFHNYAQLQGRPNGDLV